MRPLFTMLSMLILMAGCSSTQEADIVIKPKDSTNLVTFENADGSEGLVIPGYQAGLIKDEDHDGIADGTDRCLGTPIGVKVQADGCAFDRDGDGVKDYEDACPASMAHAKVKANGCADFVSFNLYYAPRVNEITPKSMRILEKAVSFLKDHPEYKVKIIGHTDEIGDEAYNMKLSEERAKDVLKIFNRKGINFKRLSSEGRGESEPVGSNNTDEGRQANRRIEVELYL